METVGITGRRYLGSKARLLPFISEVIASETRDIASFADFFAGTGCVAALFPECRIVMNDILRCNHLCHLAWFGRGSPDRDKLSGFIDRYNDPRNAKSGYMAENFADTFFSRGTCERIDFIRDDIEENSGRLTERERAILIASLIYGMDRIANTCGHYDAWRKGARPAGRLVLKLPDYIEKPHPENAFFNEDANSLAKRISADLVYIDPPYNSRQYSDAYHLLENVAQWRKLPVHGAARKMDRNGLKSRYCTKDAEPAFAELAASIRARYILVSLNNMGRRGNARSQAKLSDAAVMDALKKRGEVDVFSCDFPAFTTGKSSRGIRERLFLCRL